MTNRKNAFLNNYNWRINWLYSVWGEGIKPDNYQPSTTAIETSPLQTTNVTKVFRNGQIYIIHGDKTYDITGREVGTVFVEHP